MEKTALSFETISERIRQLDFPEVDLVIGIATGGIVPGSLVAFHLGKPFKTMTINYRDEENVPRYDSPKVLHGLQGDPSGLKVLVVDDVSVSGKTLETAVSLLKDCEVHTFVLKGTGDLSAFPEISNCVNWPWKAK
jgi:hypoxanthine phosphoribosyltransferase